MKNFLILLKREFKLFFKDTTLLSVFILAPVLYAVIFGFVYSEGKLQDLPVIVVDQDNTPLSNQLIDMLNDNEKLKVVEVKYDNIGTNDDLLKYKAVIVVVIPERFEASVLQKRYPEINTYINTTNLLTANMASQGVQTTLGTFNAGIDIQSLKKTGKNNVQAASQYEPFKVNYIRLFNESGNYLSYMWPGVLAVILQQVLLLGLAVSFSREYENKTFNSELLNRTRSAFTAIMVKVLPFWILTVFTLGMFYMFHFIFKAPVPSPLGKYVVTTALFVGSISFLGVTVSALLPSSLKATQVLMLMATPAFIIGGYSWPLEAMPAGVRFLANIIPLTPFLNAHKLMLFQNAELYQVTEYLRHLVILLVVYGILAFAAVKIKMFRELRSKRREEEGNANS